MFFKTSLKYSAFRCHIVKRNLKLAKEVKCYRLEQPAEYKKIVEGLIIGFYSSWSVISTNAK